eukprot:g3690.t1
MGRRLMFMRSFFPQDYDFFPKTWPLPVDFADFKNQFDVKTGRSDEYYIVKPDGDCMGRGIFLTDTWKKIDPSRRFVAQQYISNPLLIDGFKFDLRVYVLVTSVNPLRIYIAQAGLVRLCTAPYEKPSQKNIGKTFVHLTNYSVNKHNPSFEAKGQDEKENTNGVVDSPLPSTSPSVPSIIGSSGSKRSLEWFKYFIGDKFDKLWKDIEKIIVKTILLVQPSMANEYKSHFSDHGAAGSGSVDDNWSSSSCFQLLGFDILVDDTLRPWLIEANASPSFGTAAEVDKHVKGKVVSDCFRLLNVNKNDRELYNQRASREARNRLYSPKRQYKKMSPEELSRKKNAAEVIRREEEEKREISMKRRMLEEDAQREKDKNTFRRIYPPMHDDALNAEYAKFLAVAKHMCKMVVTDRKQSFGMKPVMTFDEAVKLLEEQERRDAEALGREEEEEEEEDSDSLSTQEDIHEYTNYESISAGSGYNAAKNAR